MHTDTERLDFLLRYIAIEDVGDDQPVYGIAVNGERLEDDLFPCGCGSSISKNDNLRDIIDRAIEEIDHDTREGSPECPDIDDLSAYIDGALHGAPRSRNTSPTAPSAHGTLLTCGRWPGRRRLEDLR